MSVLDRPELVPVLLGYCPCEGSPHGPEGDIVYLYPELSMSGGMAAQGAISEAAVYDRLGNLTHIDEVKLQELLAGIWITHGVASWTFLTDPDQNRQRETIPLTPKNVAVALPYAKGGRLVDEKASELYASTVTAPLVERLNALSKRGPTRTPARQSHNGTTRRSQRKSSSTATSAKVPPVA